MKLSGQVPNTAGDAVFTLRLIEGSNEADVDHPQLIDRAISSNEAAPSKAEVLFDSQIFANQPRSWTNFSSSVQS